MNNGLLLFFGILLAMVSSWFGFVHSPQVQFGKQIPAKDELTGSIFPSPRSGEANRGMEIYRQNGCASCHTQQVRQSGYAFSVIVDDFGTNTVAVGSVLADLSPQYSAGDTLPEVPYTVTSGTDLRTADAAVKKLMTTGAAVRSDINPTGSDIERGWGVRRTVGRDYLLDSHVMLGQQRIGPDLSNIGTRNPDVNWHLLHLFQPRLTVEDSVMPGYPYLFDKLPVNGVPDSDALHYNGELVTDDQGRQIIPRSTAKELVAYLMSLKIDGPIFEAPAPVVVAEETVEEGETATE